jgi:FtsP/CotA-like multicopper oxidase with cupredoxin domain
MARRDRFRRGTATVIAGMLLSAIAPAGASAHTGVSTCIPDPPSEISDGLRTPDVRTSVDGVLETTLRASYGPVELDGRQYDTMNFEGSVPGPTLVVCPGDRLVVHFVNDLGDTPDDWLRALPDEHGVPHDEGQRTNLHTHGMHVSPEGNSDNVFLDLAPGDTFTYEYQIPDDHPPGMYWYHPHRHGFVEPQVYAGLFGVIYVQGGLDELPELADVPTRTIVINSLQLGDGKVVPVQKSSTPKSPYLVNGVLEPEIEIRPGEVQRWRILNANDNAIVRLGLEGHTFRVLANDGITLDEAVDRKTLLIGPAERREVLVQGGPEGEYELESRAFAQFQGGNLPASTVARVRSSAAPVEQPLPAPGVLTTPQEDLRDAPVDERHRLVFTERQVGKDYEFLINGKTFDPDRIDESMGLDEVHEWTLVNATTEWHSFHIHVNDFQVIAYEGKKIPRVSNGRPRDLLLTEIDPADTVKMPPGGTVTMRTRPTDFTGKFVFHCHMLDHEDRGMMGVVTVEAT